MTKRLPNTITFNTPPDKLVGVHKGTYGFNKDTIVAVKSYKNRPCFTLKNITYVQSTSNTNKFTKINQTKFKFSNTKESWVVYTREGCPYCVKAKESLSQRIKSNNGFLQVIDGKNDIELVKQEMARVNRQDFKTWPKIFLNEEFIGGFSDLENKLKSLQ